MEQRLYSFYSALMQTCFVKSVENQTFGIIDLLDSFAAERMRQSGHPNSTHKLTPINHSLYVCFFFFFFLSAVFLSQFAYVVLRCCRFDKGRLFSLLVLPPTCTPSSRTTSTEFLLLTGHDAS